MAQIILEVLVFILRLVDRTSHSDTPRLSSQPDSEIWNQPLRNYQDQTFTHMRSLLLWKRQSSRNKGIVAKLSIKHAMLFQT
jgi:hypothetical protein